jgi:WD40 repeat protein
MHLGGFEDFRTPIFHSSGKWLFTSGANGVLAFWESSSTLIARELPPPAGRLPGVALELTWSPDGKSLFALCDNMHDNIVRMQHEIYHLDAATGAKRRTLSLRAANEPDYRMGRTAESLRVSADGRTLACVDGDAHQALLFNLETGQEARRLSLPEDMITSHISSDANYLIVGRNNMVFTQVELANDKRIDFTYQADAILPAAPQAFPGQNIARAFKAEYTPGNTQVLAAVTRANNENGYLYYLLDIKSGKFFPVPELGKGDNGRQIYDWRYAPDSLHLFTSDNQIVECATMQPVLNLNRDDNSSHLGELSSVTFSPDGRYLAFGTSDGRVVLLDRRTGDKRMELSGHTQSVRAISFAPDGKHFASSSNDGVVLCWKMPAITPPPTVPVIARELDDAWSNLGHSDSYAAYQSLLKLVQGGDDTVKLIRDHFKDFRGDSATITQLIGDLDNDESTVRERASMELIKRGTEVEAQIRATLDNPPSLEVKARCKIILEALKSPRNTHSIAAIRLRAITALEWIGSTQAAEVLKTLAKGALAERERSEAKAALERIEKAKAAK